MGGFVERWHQFRRSMSIRIPKTKVKENEDKIHEELSSNTVSLPLQALAWSEEADTSTFSRKKTLSWPRRLLRRSFIKHKKEGSDGSPARNSLSGMVASGCGDQSSTKSIGEPYHRDKSLDPDCQLNLVTNAIVCVGQDSVSDGAQSAAEPVKSAAVDQCDSSTRNFDSGVSKELAVTLSLDASDMNSSNAFSDPLSFQNDTVASYSSRTRTCDGDKALENLPSTYGSFVESLTDSQALNSTHTDNSDRNSLCSYCSQTARDHENGRESPSIESVSSVKYKCSFEPQPNFLTLSPTAPVDGAMSCSSDDLGCDEIPKSTHRKRSRRFSNTSVRSNSSWIANTNPDFNRGWSYKENRRLRKLSNSSIASWQRGVRRRPSRGQKFPVPVILINSNEPDAKNRRKTSYVTTLRSSNAPEAHALRASSCGSIPSQKSGLIYDSNASLRANHSWIRNKENFVRGWSTKKSQRSQSVGSAATRLSVRKHLLRRNVAKRHTPVQSDISKIVRRTSLRPDTRKKSRQGSCSASHDAGKCDNGESKFSNVESESKRIPSYSDISCHSRDSSISGDTLRASWSSLSTCGDVTPSYSCQGRSEHPNEDPRGVVAPKGPSDPTNACLSEHAPAFDSSGSPTPGSLNYWSAGAVVSSASSESGEPPKQQPCGCGFDHEPHGAPRAEQEHIRWDSARHCGNKAHRTDDKCGATVIREVHDGKLPRLQDSAQCRPEKHVRIESFTAQPRETSCEGQEHHNLESIVSDLNSFNAKNLDREAEVLKIVNFIYDGEADGVRDGKPKPPPVDVSGGGGEAEPLRTPPAAQQLTPRTPGGLSGRHDTLRDKERKIGHRRVGEGGQVTYKKIGTNQIMGSIQLGIHQAVGSLAGIPELDVLIQDFYVVETISFPPNGSETTPAHPYSDYRFKVYAPTAFRHFRDLFRIAPSDYLVSLCNEDLRELSNPGASGSIFYVTNDDEFIIKTVQHKEAEFLQKLLPGYYMNLNQNPRTLLPKFFGLYTYQCNAKNIRLVTMNNLLPSSVKMHQKYDLKGSTYKRKANRYERSKSSPTYKDLDFMEHHPEGILLEADTYKALMNTLERDCRVLASFKIMDYSLLVGIHNLDLAAREKQERANGRNGGKGGGGGQGGSTAAGGGSASDDDSGAAGGGDEENAEGAPGLSRSRSINRQRLVAHSTAMESIQADAADPIDEEDHVPPGGIPARNVKGERLLLFLGIIDILQSYRLKKKLEHTLKSMVTDGDTISVHRPNFYAQRFQKFMAERVFKRIPSRGSGRGSDSSSHGDVLGPTSPPATGPHRSSLHHVRSSHHHVTTVAIQEDRTDVVRKGPKLRFKGLGEDDEDVHPGDQQSPDIPPVTLTRYTTNTISVSDVRLETRTDSRSTLSVDSSMASSGHGGHRTHTWTPPLSVEGSTPTWTEGTPSFTESSSSGDLGCPNTPNRSLNTTVDSAQHETEMTWL